MVTHVIWFSLEFSRFLSKAPFLLNRRLWRCQQADVCLKHVCNRWPYYKHVCTRWSFAVFLLCLAHLLARLWCLPRGWTCLAVNPDFVGTLHVYFLHSRGRWPSLIRRHRVKKEETVKDRQRSSPQIMLPYGGGVCACANVCAVYTRMCSYVCMSVCSTRAWLLSLGYFSSWVGRFSRPGDFGGSLVTSKRHLFRLNLT